MALALALVAFSTCSTAAPPAASPSGPEKITSSDKTASELLALYNRSQAAMAKRDLTGFQGTIDLTRAAFRRCQSEVFDIAAATRRATHVCTSPHGRQVAPHRAT